MRETLEAKGIWTLGQLLSEYPDDLRYRYKLQAIASDITKRQFLGSPTFHRRSPKSSKNRRPHRLDSSPIHHCLVRWWHGVKTGPERAEVRYLLVLRRERQLKIERTRDHAET
jgi:hypothetical protein